MIEMAKYHEGYKEALNQVETSNREEMLDWLDGLQGTERLNIRATDFEIRQELRRQVQEDFSYEDDSSCWASDMLLVSREMSKYQ